MRTLALISLLSAAVVITAAEPANVTMPVAYTACTAANAATVCASMHASSGDAVCGSITGKNTTTGALLGTASTQCLPRHAVTQLGNATFGTANLTMAVVASASTTPVTRTSCVNEDTCNITGGQCCVYSAYTFNGVTQRSNNGYCANATTYLTTIHNHTITTVNSAWPLRLDLHCFREFNQDLYAALYDSSANFFAFSMAVIFGLLALFAY